MATSYLVVTGGPGKGKRHPLEEGKDLTIGRERDNVIVLSDTRVSRHHAVARVGESIEIEDAGSTNGTFLNGTRIEGREQLRPGDSLRIGRTELTLQVEGARQVDALKLDHDPLAGEAQGEPVQQEPEPEPRPEPVQPPEPAQRREPPRSPSDLDTSYAGRLLVSALVLAVLITFVIAVIITSQ
jgi:pSer/pThr/pTyr-binding forkhead associated (FHA) protein